MTHLSPFRGTIPALLAGVAVLLLVPGVASLAHWQWQPGNSPALPLLRPVIACGGAFVAALFCIALQRCLRPGLCQALLLTLILGLTMAGGAFIKSAAKRAWQTPRPYAVWVADNHPAAATLQYRPSELGAFIARQDFPPDLVPPWQQKYWASESGFAFPSGHTWFAAQWALLALVLLRQQRKAWPVIALIFGWALLVQVSRLVLGMHWPGDLAASCLLAAALTLCAYAACVRLVFAPRSAARTFAAGTAP